MLQRPAERGISNNTERNDTRTSISITAAFVPTECDVVDAQRQQPTADPTSSMPTSSTSRTTATLATARSRLRSSSGLRSRSRQYLRAGNSPSHRRIERQPINSMHRRRHSPSSPPLRRLAFLTVVCLSLSLFSCTSFYAEAIAVSTTLLEEQQPSSSNEHHRKNNILTQQRHKLVQYTNANIIQPIRDQYEQLSPNGKFMSTAFVGFTTSRVVVRTTVKATVKVAKVAGAAFIVSEVLHSAGILNDDNVDDYYQDSIQNIKSQISSKINQGRLLVRKHCNMEKMKQKFDQCLEDDRIGTLGFTTGVVAALVL